MHTRMKVGLKALGVIANADPRPPLMPVLPEFRERISDAVGAAHRAGDISLAPGTPDRSEAVLARNQAETSP
jgi:4-hydroxy-tetrahydrodipicolinate synthase